MANDMRKKVVALTGASSGIGWAAALEFAKRGADLALIARNAERLEQIKQLVEAEGVRAIALPTDITDPAAVNAAVAQTLGEFGRLDVFVANAGIYARAALTESSLDDIRAIMETNFYGSLNCAYAALTHFKTQGGGSLVTVISMDGKKGMPPDGAYVASKFALNGFNQVLRQELRESGIHIGAVFPSHTDTPQMHGVKAPKIAEKMKPEQVAKAIVKCAQKRKKEVLVPFFSCKLLVWADAISPSLSDWLARAFKLGGTDI